MASYQVLGSRLTSGFNLNSHVFHHPQLYKKINKTRQLRLSIQASKSPPVNPRNSPKDTNTPSISWRLYNVRVAADSDPGKDDYLVHSALKKAIEKRLSIRKGSSIPDSSINLVRKSFDARKKLPSKAWMYVVDIDEKAITTAGARLPIHQQGHSERIETDHNNASAISPNDIQDSGTSPPPSSRSEVPTTKKGTNSQHPVVVIGSGPAGLFAALEIAETGCAPVILLERGQPVDIRGKDIGALFVRKRINPESNLCYGEGGAGTWSDGKLTTRIGRNDDPVRRVLNTLASFGAPPNILVSGKPHLGTDNLVRILKAFRGHLHRLGTKVHFGACVSKLIVKDGAIAGVKLTDGSEIAASRVVLAVGHSARDMYAHLQSLDVAMTPKPFAMGYRIEHPQSLINEIQYGEKDAAMHVLKGKGTMPVADYGFAVTLDGENLSSLSQGLWNDPTSWYAPLYEKSVREASQQKNSIPKLADVSVSVAESSRRDAGDKENIGSQQKRGVYSFCMCPGGQIVPTSTNEEELCINGMSFSRRNSQWANSALVVTVNSSDWEHYTTSHGALAGVALQRDIEREAARRGGGQFVAPVQRVTDFLTGQWSPVESLPTSSYRLGVKSSALHDLYPQQMYEAFCKALERCNRQLPGFISDHALLHAAETRTSAPVRIERSDRDAQSVSIAGLYPCGEGAGWAGGIISAAVDGVRVGRSIAAEISGRSDLAEMSMKYSSIKVDY